MLAFVAALSVVGSAVAAPAFNIALPEGRRLVLSEWANCGTEADQICPTKNVTLTPDPPTAGKIEDIKFFCDAKEETKEGELEAQIFLGPVKIDTEKISYCKLLKCPAPEGRRVAEIKHDLPDKIPRGTAITIHNEAKDGDKVIFCTTLHFTIQ